MQLEKNKTHSRDPLSDNIKFILIFLVVFGHLLEMFSVEGKLGIIRSWIYSFHMPLFIMISGYYSKNTEKQPEQSVKSLLIPYLIFNSIYAFIVYRKYLIDIFTPNFGFWYLLVLFFWRILIKYIEKIRFILPISILLSLYAGLLPLDRLFALQRTIAFLPFFIIGFLLKKEDIKKIRKTNKTVSIILILIGSFITIYFNIKGTIPIKQYEFIQCYKASDMSNINGILFRLLTIIISLIMSFAIVNLASDKNRFYTKFGKNSITIYIFSLFFTCFFALVMRKTFIWNYLMNNILLTVMICLVLSFIIILIFGNDKFYRLYCYVLNKINSLIFKKA